MKNNKKDHYHFIGIGGIGMGTLASIILSRGQVVTGSDIKENKMTKSLLQKGATIRIGHSKENITQPDYVIYSSAISSENVELITAKEKSIPIIKRGALLAKLMKDQIGITVAGAHGKTTTSSMVAHLLVKAGFFPSIAVGGYISGPTDHAHLGNDQYFVAEVDESDGSFLYFHPFYSIITNIDYEHIDFYQGWDKIIQSYKEFVEGTHSQGYIIACGDDTKLMDIIRQCSKKYLTYGLTSDLDLIAQSIKQVYSKKTKSFCTEFGVIYGKKFLGTLTLNVPGKHNVLNALACVGLGLKLSIDFCVIKESLLSYQGVKRRFQVKGHIHDITIVDDYGHHPTEIAATLQTAQLFKANRLVTVFQPHRYSRTKFLMKEFIKSLSLSDYLIITDIYSASESPIKGVTAQLIKEQLNKIGYRNVSYVSRPEILDFLLNFVNSGDMILTLGAGDITQVSDELVRVLTNRNTLYPQKEHR